MLELLLIGFLIEEIWTGGAVTASILGAAGGAVTGAVRSVAASTRKWYAGHRQRLSGKLLGRLALWIESALIGLVTGTVTGVREGTGPGVRKAHQLRRRGRSKAKSLLRQAWLKLKELREKLAEKRRQEQVSEAEDDPRQDDEEQGQEDPQKPEQEAATDGQDDTEQAHEEVPELVGDEGVQPMNSEEMSAEAGGVLPYMKTWDAPGPTLEEIENGIQAAAAQLVAASDANGRFNVGGEIDAAQALQAAADAISNARELVAVVATTLHEKYDAAAEHLGNVESEAAADFVGQQ